MKNSKGALLGAVIAMTGAIILVSVGSIKSAAYHREGGMAWALFPGNVQLRNTIEIPLSDIDSLVMEYGGKNIKVYASEEEKVIIKEYLYSSSPMAIASVSYGEDKEVTVTGGQTNVIAILGFFGGGEKIEVYIPEKSLAKLYLKVGSGNVTSEASCTREDGSLTVHSGSGNIKWRQAVAENLSFQAGSGNIALWNMKGSLAVGTGSGNITMTEISGSGVVEAGSGNVKVEAAAVTGDMSLTTGSGNIRLELPEDLSFHFQAETGSGAINVDFDDDLSYNKKGNYAEGEVGSGEPRVEIRVKANSGNVRVSN